MSNDRAEGSEAEASANLARSQPGARELEPEATVDPVVPIGVVVICCALAGISYLLAKQHVSTLWWLLTVVFIAIAAGTAVWGVLRWQRERFMPGLTFPRRRQARVLIATATMLGTVVALMVPAALISMPQQLAQVAQSRLAPLSETDRVITVPRANAPILIHRALDTQVIVGGEARSISTGDSDHPTVVAMSADGSWIVTVTSAPEQPLTTELTRAQDGEDAAAITVLGVPVALQDSWLVMRECETPSDSDSVDASTAETCRLLGYDLSAAEAGELQAAWSILDPGDGRAPDPSGEARDLNAEWWSAITVLGRTGIVPPVAVVHDPVQGWIQRELETGFPLGGVLVPPTEHCRIAATLHPDAPTSVVTVCAGAAGELTARGFANGEEQWSTDPSPSGAWKVRFEHGTAIAIGTETGTDIEGEMIAGSGTSMWAPPGGAATAQVGAWKARIALQGSHMVAVTSADRVVGVNAITGENFWVMQAPNSGSVRGALGPGGVVISDQPPREHPWSIGHTTRVRMLEVPAGSDRYAAPAAPSDGAGSDGSDAGRSHSQSAVHEVRVRDRITRLDAVGLGSALVTTEHGTYLLTPKTA